ncbi:MAG TPA: shikimate kinase [Archangium sp.]|jgi:shikimate kinase|uniref:shikimate kinase n=1 Tax=Archangium sp. TaxID=1872627 RepID=UPI002ED8CB81
MSGPSAEQRHPFVEQILEAVDPRLAPSLREELARPGLRPRPTPEQTVVIAGHRSAGKTRLLPMVSGLLGRSGMDLDHELERRHGRPLREWVTKEPESFRQAERALFLELPRGSLVAVGGGFIAYHAETLHPCYTLLVPISFETYRERLLADTTRPRLRPGMSLEEEISSIYEQRSLLHSRVHTVSLVEFLRAFASPEGAP